MCADNINKDNTGIVISFFSLAISLISLGIAFLTLYLSKIKRGTIKMTPPNLICFVPKNGNDEPKVFLRTLLYSTSEKGQIIQNLFVKVTCNGAIQDFNVWAYGEKQIVRGSGLFVERSGVSVYHHFLLPKHDSTFQFTDGNYHLQVYSQIVNEKPKKIFEYNLHVSIDEATLIKAGRPLYFDWDGETYKSHNDLSNNPMSAFPSLNS